MLSEIAPQNATPPSQHSKKRKKAARKRRLSRAKQAESLCVLKTCGALLYSTCGCKAGSCFRDFFKQRADLHPKDPHEAARAILDLRNERFCESYLNEGEWLWEAMLEMRRVGSPNEQSHGEAERHRGKPGGAVSAPKYHVDYHLRGTRVCGLAWHQMAGWRCQWTDSIFGGVRPRIPRRAQEFAKRISVGGEDYPKTGLASSGDVKAERTGGTRTAVADLWIADYFGLVCDTSPAADGVTATADYSGVAYYPPTRPGFCFMLYKDDVQPINQVSRSLFNRRLKAGLKTGLQVGGKTFELKPRTVRARGFKKCTVCENIDEKIRAASRYQKGMSREAQREKRRLLRLEKDAHLQRVRACRAEYAKHKYDAITKPDVASVAIDAAAQAGHRIPVTASESPVFAGMEKLQLKITGMLSHGEERGYRAVVTPPWLKTGANMTCTILMQLVRLGGLKGKRRLYLQVDGASDNVAYTVMYFAAWLMLMSQQQRFGDLLVLDSIVMSRLPVGHTHIDIDQVFSVFARHLFGRKKSGLRHLDVHSIEQFEAELRKAHAGMLSEYLLLTACFDFDAYFKDSKRPATDTGIKGWRVFEFKTDTAKPGVVQLRTQKQMDGGGPILGGGPEGWVQWRAGAANAGVFWSEATDGSLPGPARPDLAIFKVALSPICACAARCAARHAARAARAPAFL